MNNFVKIFCTSLVSASIIYFTYTLSLVVDEIKQVRQQLPVVIADVERIEKQVNVDEWINLVSLLEKQVPDILQQAERIRGTVDDVNGNIPAILTEVKALRQQTVPPVLEHVNVITKQSIPAILKESQALRNQTIPSVLVESKAIREQALPPVLTEVAQVRAMVPPTLTRVEKLVNSAEEAADEASQGAVKGTIKGILTTPLNLIKDTGNAVLNLEKDEEKKSSDSD